MFWFSASSELCNGKSYPELGNFPPCAVFTSCTCRSDAPQALFYMGFEAKTWYHLMLVSVNPELYTPIWLSLNRGISYTAFKWVSSFKGQVSDKMISGRPSSELSGDGSILALYPDSKRFQQFLPAFERAGEASKTFDFYKFRENWQLGETQTQVHRGKPGSTMVLYILSDSSQLSNKYMCPTFSKSSLAITRQLTLFWQYRQHNEEKISMHRAVLPMGHGGTTQR